MTSTLWREATRAGVLRLAAGTSRAGGARLDPLADDPDALTPASSALAFVPRWIGVLPYEAFRGSLERAAWPRDLVAAVASLRWAAA